MLCVVFRSLKKTRKSVCASFTTVCNSSLTYTTYKPSHRSHTIIPLSNHHTIIIPKSLNLRNYMDIFNHEQYLERWWWWCIQSKYGDTYRKKGTHSISFHEEVKGYDWYLYIQRRNAFCWECWELGVFFTKVIKHISKKVESVESLGTYRYIKCTQVYPTLKLLHVSTNRLCVLLFQVGIFQTWIELNPGVGPHTSLSKSFKNFVTVFNTRMRYILEP